jgi:DASH complex subunit DAD2
MSFAPRTTTIRPSSGLGLGGSQNSQSSALQARIHEKKSELESLRQLRDLSAGLAGQMQQLEEKLATLSDGTEAVAAVMANWGSVLRAVSMASGEFTCCGFGVWAMLFEHDEADHGCSGHSKAERGRW